MHVIFIILLKYACKDFPVLHGILGFCMKLEIRKTLQGHVIVSTRLLFPSLFNLILLHAVHVSILTIYGYLIACLHQVSIVDSR